MRGSTYLLYDEMQILLPTLFLIPNTFELDLAPLLQSRLDIHLQHLVLRRSLPRNLIKRLPLDLHLFMHAIEQLLQREGQRPHHCRDLGGRRPRSPRRLRTTKPRAPRPTTPARPRHARAKDIVEVIMATAHPPLPAQELGEDELGVAEVEPSVAVVTAGLELVVEGTRAPAWHASKVVAGRRLTGTGIALTSGARFWGWGPTAEHELEPILIIRFPLFGIGQDLVRLGNLLELICGFGVVFVLIGVVLEG